MIIADMGLYYFSKLCGFMILLFCLSFGSYIFDKLNFTPKGFGKEISGWARTRMSCLGWRLTGGHYPPCSVWLVFLYFNKSIDLSHRLVSQKKEKKKIFTLLSLRCETWEPLSISWDKINTFRKIVWGWGWDWGWTWLPAYTQGMASLI